MARTRRRKGRSGRIDRGLDPARWAYFIYALGGFLAAWVLSHLIEDVWALLWGYFPQYVPRTQPFAANLAGIVLAIVATLVALRRKDWFQFLTEVVVEISQVVWPTKAETRAATVVVIVITLISSGLLATMDAVWSAVTDWIYGI